MRAALKLVKGLTAVAAPIALIAAAAPAAHAAVPFGDGSRQAFNILAPGEFGGLPSTANSRDQLALYDALTPRQGHVGARDVSRYFKSERFGVQGRVVRVEHPRSGVRILRDSFDVPHIYGRTRDDVTFAMGWAAAEDRGLLMEEGRGPGRLAALDAPGIDAFGLIKTLRQFIPSPQADAYVAGQADVLRRMGARGQRVLRDFQEWVAGINAYYTQRVPAASRPKPWTLADAFGGFAFIGQIFGNGGGHEVANSGFLSSLQARLGVGTGLSVFRDLRQSNDPESPVTVPGSFPYQLEPSGPSPGSVVIDPGSIQLTPAATVRSAPAAPTAPPAASNALLVSARRSATHHPLAVMGPQLGYFYPEIVMEVDVHGGGFDARGAAAPVGPWMLIGRTKHYAWSLTSATNDNTDQFLEQLCNPDGSAPTRSSTSYMYKGHCLPMSNFDAGLLKGTGGQPDQEVTFHETVHGPVSGTVTVGGRPYAIATLRANRGREPASALALADLTANRVRSVKGFYEVANEFETTFNWHYLDARNIAFFSSGRLPVRAPGTDPSLPTLGTGAYDWRRFLTLVQHPHGANPPGGLILNWNNRPARNWGSADDQFSYGSVHRVQLFRGFPRRARLNDVVSIMNRAATEDGPAVLVWPIIKAVLAGGPAPSPLSQQAAAAVSAWVAHGASRLDVQGNGRLPAGAAVFDAAWPGLADAVLRPVLGDLTDSFAALNGPDNPASPSGSSYSHGWYGYVSKDLRTLLGRRVRGPFSRRYCGGGDLTACRASLWTAIQNAATGLAAAQGADPSTWHGDANAERIRFIPGLLSDTIRWTNRPTFQQAIEFAR